VGLNVGDNVVYYNLPGSMTANVTELARSSNVGIKGRWMFRVDGPNILLPNRPTSKVKGQLVETISSG
jgi:hypothetical protein